MFEFPLQKRQFSNPDFTLILLQNLKKIHLKKFLINILSCKINNKIYDDFLYQNQST